MGARVYATRAQLVAFAPASVTVPADPEATRRLTRASEFMERCTMSAVYPTDTVGYPSDAAMRQAFQDATCAQVVAWLDGSIDEQGVQGRYEQVAIGSARLVKGANATTNGQELAPQADTILRTAGALPGSLVQIRTWEGGWL